LSQKRYINNCKYCGQIYVAKSLKSNFDSDKCRGAYNRKRRKGILSKDLSSREANCYTDQDIWILIGQICRADQSEGPTDLAEVIHHPAIVTLIADFEKRFLCNFEEVMTAHPHIRPGKTKLQCQAIADHYEGMEYSN